MKLHSSPSGVEIRKANSCPEYLHLLVFPGEGVGAGDQALEPDGLGAQRVARALLEDEPAAGQGQIGLALDGVLFIEVAQPLDFRQGIEWSAGRVIDLDRRLDHQQVGLDPPAGFLGDLQVVDRECCAG